MTGIDAKTGHGVFKIGDRLVGVPVDNLVEVCVVPELSSLMEPEGALLGAFDLRDSMVPLLDVEVLSGIPKRSRAVEKAAVVRYRERVTALAVDEIVNLTEARPTETRYGSAGTSPGAKSAVRRLFESGFVLNGTVVNCLDIEALFDRADVPSVFGARGSTGRGEAAQGRKYLIFTSGGAHFGVDAMHISATVPRKNVDSRELGGEGGLCMGFIDHHGWKVPVVNASQVLGLGSSAAPRETETVVLRFPGDKLLALAVDATERLSTIPDDLLKPASPILARRALLPHVFVSDTGAQVYTVDFEELCKREDLASIAELAIHHVAENETATRAPREEEGIVREAVRYLIFNAGHKRAVPAAQISRILPMPDDLIPPGDMPNSVKGVFAVGDRSVPLVSLHEGSPDGCADSYVLLVSLDDTAVGFVAERICGIQTSDWRSAGEATGEPDLVQVTDQGEATILPVSDLHALARSLISEAEFS